MAWRICAGLICGAMGGIADAARKPHAMAHATGLSNSDNGPKSSSKVFVAEMNKEDVERLVHDKTWGISWVEDWDNPSKRGARTEPSVAHEHPSNDGAKKTKKKGGQRQLILIRHGQYQNESSDNDSIRTLTPLGVSQAKRTGQFLLESLESSPLFVARSAKRIVSSDLMRAKETAQHMLDSLEPSHGSSSGALLRGQIPILTVDSLLREKYPCDPSPPHSKRASTSHMRLTEEAFSKYFHRPLADENSVEVLVCHANVIRYMILRALQLPPEAWLRFSLPHCSITSLTISANGHVKVHAIGSFSHLPPDMQTVHNIA